MVIRNAAVGFRAHTQDDACSVALHSDALVGSYCSGFRPESRFSVTHTTASGYMRSLGAGGQVQHHAQLHIVFCGLPEATMCRVGICSLPRSL